MGRVKIALLHCQQPHEGPWLRPQGRETGVNVYPELGQGEEVIVDVERLFASPAGIEAIHVRSGFTPLDLTQAERYRVRKLGSGTPTNVEVIFNGKPSS